MPTRLWFLFVFNCCMICCYETGMLGATAEPGRPTNFAPISFSAWNSAHHRPRKVTPILSPIVNATQMYHIHDSWFAGICFPHFSQAGFRQSGGQVCESQCLREDLRGAYAEPTRGYAISSSHSGVLGSPKVLRFYSRRSIPDLHKTNHSCAPNCLEIFLNKPIIGTKQANHN